MIAMIKTHHKYIFKSYLFSILIMFSIFLSLVLVLNIFEEINFLKDTNVSFYYPVLLTFLNAPSIIFEIFPFIFLISTQFFFIKIIEKDELNLLKKTGLSSFDIIKILVIISTIVGIFIVVVFYDFSSKFKYIYLDLKNKFATDNKYLAVITENGIWIKDEINNKISIINSDEIGNYTLKNVSIVEFNSNYDFQKYIYSKEIDISSNNWIIKNAEVTNRNSSTTKEGELIFESNFDYNKINSLFSNLSSLGLWDLQDLKENYKSIGYSTAEIEIHSLKIFTYPIYLSIMSILSAVIMMNLNSKKPLLFHIMTGIILSVIIYYINHFSSVLGLNGNLPPNISIILPLIILSLFCVMGLVRINEK